MSYQTRQLLKQFWRSEGNPRLRGLLLAGLPNTGVDSEDVGRAWITDPNERKRHLQHVPDIKDGVRTLKAPASQQYTPGVHEDFADSSESASARTLAKGTDLGLNDDEAQRFLAGETSVDKDKYTKRALLNNDVAELDVLFREELETTIIQGAAPRKVARDAANVVNVTKRKGDLPRGSDQAYAEKGSQGSAIRTGDKSFDAVPFECERYGAGFEITDELVRESEPDVLETLVRDAGAQVENSINREFVTNLVENAGQEHDTAGSEQDVTMVNKGIEQVEMQNFVADTSVMHPQFKTALFEDSNLAYANRAGSDETIRNREFNPLFGLQMFTMSDGALDPSSSETWGFANDGEMGGIVYQREHAALTIWSDFDMETEDYDDPIRRLQGGNVVSYVDSVFRQEDSAARIEY